MLREGTRVVVVDEQEARRHFANVRNGQKGTVGRPHVDNGTINVHVDGDSSPIAWTMRIAWVKRLHEKKRG